MDKSPEPPSQSPPPRSSSSSNENMSDIHQSYGYIQYCRGVQENDKLAIRKRAIYLGSDINRDDIRIYRDGVQQQHVLLHIAMVAEADDDDDVNAKAPFNFFLRSRYGKVPECFLIKS